MPISGPKNHKPDQVQKREETENKKVNTHKEALVPRKKNTYIDHLNMSDSTLRDRLKGPVPPRTISPSEKENRLEQLKPQIRADLKKRDAEQKKQALQEMTIKAESGDVKAQLWVAKKHINEKNPDMAIKYYNMAGGSMNLEAQQALTQIYAAQFKELSLDSLTEGIAFCLESQELDIVTTLFGELEERAKAGDADAQQIFDLFSAIISSA